MTWGRVARFLIRLHPPAWRRRYADEVGVLIEDAPPSFSAVADLARSAVGQWMLSTWSSVVIEPAGWPHPGRLMGLYTLVVAGMLAGALAAAALEVAFDVTFLLTYGMSQRAWEVLVMEAGRFSVPLRPMEILGTYIFTVLWFALPALPVILLARFTGLGRRFPIVTRIAVAVAFATVAIWLLGGRMILGTLVGGWILASGLFPRDVVSTTRAMS